MAQIDVTIYTCWFPSREHSSRSQQVIFSLLLRPGSTIVSLSSGKCDLGELPASHLERVYAGMPAHHAADHVILRSFETKTNSSSKQAAGSEIRLEIRF